MILSYDEALPYFAIEQQLVELYRQKIKEVSADKLCIFVCKKAFVKGLNKTIYSFDKFYFPDKEDNIDYENEYAMLAYNNDISQCKRERDLYFKNISTEIPILNARNSQSPDTKDGLAHLNLLDIVYLQNFRIFMKLETDVLETGVLYPHLDFSIQEVNINIRYPSIPLCRMLLNKDDETLGSKTFGYLTLTVRGTVLPLMHDADEEVKKYAIVGLWTFGEDISAQSLDNCKSTQSRVWGLFTHFFKTSKISYRYTYTKQKNSFLFISFNKSSAPKIFLFKMTDKSGLESEISLDQYKIDYKETQGSILKDQKTKVKSYNIDLSTIPREPSSHNSFEIQQGYNPPVDRLTSTTGIQAEMRESVDSDLSYKMRLKYYQETNDAYFKKTIEGMQDQLKVLSQAIVAINQNLAILNQKVMNGHSEKNTDTFILPNLTNNSLSISASSHNLVFADDLKVSKTLSEVQPVSTNNKHKRYKTNDIEVIKEKDLDNLMEPKSLDNQTENEKQDKIFEKPSSLNNSSNFGFTTIHKAESIEPEDEEMKNPIMSSLNQMKQETEYNPKNQNNGSIHVPKINPKFKRYVPSSDSEISDTESDALYKTAKLKYSK